MSTKKKASRRTRRAIDLRTVADVVRAEHARGLTLVLERLGHLEQKLAINLRALNEERQRRRVFVLLIGEYLSRPLPRMRPATVPPWAYTAPELEPQDEPKIERGFMSGTIVVTDEDGARAVVRIEDPARRLWAPGAWLIAFNGAVLEHVRVGDMAQGNGVASPIVLLNQPIQPAIVVQATVRLDTFPESPR